jgi:hypothetical protein
MGGPYAHRVGPSPVGARCLVFADVCWPRWSDRTLSASTWSVVQAKGYDKEDTVQRPDIQAFVGALQGAQTSRGVFVTTGRFSPGAR